MAQRAADRMQGLGRACLDGGLLVQEGSTKGAARQGVVMKPAMQKQRKRKTPWLASLQTAPLAARFRGMAKLPLAGPRLLVRLPATHKNAPSHTTSATLSRNRRRQYAGLHPQGGRGRCIWPSTSTPPAESAPPALPRCLSRRRCLAPPYARRVLFAYVRHANKGISRIDESKHMKKRRPPPDIMKQSWTNHTDLSDPP